MGVTVEENSLPIEEASVLVSGVYRSWIRFDVAVLREERNEIDFQYRGKAAQRLGENDKIVTRYVEVQDFQNAAFDGLADEIFDSVLAGHS